MLVSSWVKKQPRRGPFDDEVHFCNVEESLGGVDEHLSILNVDHGDNLFNKRYQNEIVLLVVNHNLEHVMAKLAWIFYVPRKFIIRVNVVHRADQRSAAVEAHLQADEVPHIIFTLFDLGLVTNFDADARTPNLLYLLRTVVAVEEDYPHVLLSGFRSFHKLNWPRVETVRILDVPQGVRLRQSLLRKVGERAHLCTAANSMWTYNQANFDEAKLFQRVVLVLLLLRSLLV
mmetsp:Transcript_2172/g.6469  ORF Transcript_2172/g.6469 Transcript_2172/m.6469 type:complete len:231 (+) Transcript_2172:413-1105(+)